MKQITGFLIIACLTFSSICPRISGISLDAYAEPQKETKEYETCITYDIWKHSNGTWQYTGSPGSSFSFNSSTAISIDPSKKLIDVKAEFLHVSSGHRWYDASISSADVKTVSHSSTSVSYSVSGNLNANVMPMDIKQYSWQSATVEGYRYNIPIKIVVEYEIPDVVQELPPSDEEIPESEEPPPIDEPETEYTVEADLVMPATAYRGHKVLLQDCSVFSDGTDFYTPFQFYRNGLGSNSFRKESGSGKMSTYKVESGTIGYYTDRYGVFSEAGEYSVKLTARINEGYAATDIEHISILPVPDITAKIGGVQKANRKQLLNIQTALDPEAKLVKIWAEISEKGGNNKVHLDYYPGQNNTISNSSLIKTRAIAVRSTSPYFENVYLEFLTKNVDIKEMCYTVYVEDSNGNTDSDTGYFTVIPDEPPEAEISIDKYHLRNKGQNTAEILIEDASDSKGDELERHWYSKVETSWTDSFDYFDRSFGSEKAIMHIRKGVGKAEYKLTVRDKISDEETLSEYISASDFKTSTAYGETEVINIAPVVSLSMKDNPEAEILVVTSDDNINEAKNETDKLKIKFAEHGINLKINFQAIEGNLSDKNDFGKVYSVDSPFSYNAQDTSYSDSNFISDSRSLFKLNANFGAYGGGAFDAEPYPDQPYTIQSFDLSSGALRWEKSFTNEVMDAADSFSLCQDDTEDYLYIISKGQTLLVNKSDGALLGVVNCELKGSNFVSEKNIYSFSGRGIYKVNRATGTVNILDDSSVYGKSRRLKGKINFSVNKAGVLNRGYFDPEKETFEYSELSGTEVSEHRGMEFDIHGNMAAQKITEGEIDSIKIWDETNNLINEVQAEGYGRDCILIKDDNGSFKAAGFANSRSRKNNSGKKRYYVYVKVEDIYTGYSANTGFSSYNGAPTRPEFLYGYLKDGKLCLVTAAEHWYVWGRGTSSYTETSYCIMFDPEENTVSSYVGAGNFSWLRGIFYENGSLSDESLSMQLTEGNPQEDGISGSDTVFCVNGKTANSLLTKYYNKYLNPRDNVYTAMIILDKNGIIEAGELEQLSFYKNADKNKSKVYHIASGADTDSCMSEFIEYISNEDVQSNQRMIYSKGERISLKAIYSDYESDPSKASYYLYYHYPYNDGANPQVNYRINDDFSIMATMNNTPVSKPIEVFYQDGMYKVEHWQYDNTGNAAYDKKSNVAEMIFYIQGDTIAPYIEKISTEPYPAKEGKPLSVKVDYNDEDKETLTLLTKIYKDNELIQEDLKKGLIADELGKYPQITVPVSSSAESGSYRVICKVSDSTSTGIKEYSFAVTSGYRLSGRVNHTIQWDINRKKYNSFHFSDECNYISHYNAYVLQQIPRKRGINVFWSEEKFVLQAAATGNPVRVTANIKNTDYTVELNDSGIDDAEGNRIYKGELWDKNVKGHWGNADPVQVVFSFDAYYDDGIKKSVEDQIIIDDTDPYWRMHRLY